MPYIIESALGAFFAIYLLIVCVLVVGWIRAQRIPVTAALSHVKSSDSRSLISVLIAARNEANRLPLLIRDLKQQRGCNFEVIIINDGSEDETVVHSLDAIGGDPRFSLIESIARGKKAALTLGVSHAKGSIILTTDGDCRVGPEWIADMTSAFYDPSLMLVFGPVRIIGSSSLFDKLQSIEFTSLIGVAAATAALQKPTMCNGANLSYRKEVFAKVGGYSSNLDVPSGDDEFLMRKILKVYPRSIQYCSGRGAMVTTAPASTLKAFFHQRLRWAGKWRYNDEPTAQLLATYVFLFHLTTILLPWLPLFHIVTPSFAIAGFTARAVGELVYLKIVTEKLDIPWRWGAFFVLQFVYSYYVVVVAICSQFFEFEWKGRRLRSFSNQGSIPDTKEEISTLPHGTRR
ncbi:glycosyltransferase [Chryseolinea sp. T2]|uniref:glycosyltransferase n=1 Tax=Chryseolinea sp. T2 TaxID=3129255 RepID=UPI0030778DD7